MHSRRPVCRPRTGHLSDMTACVASSTSPGLPVELRRLATWVGLPITREVTAESVACFRSALHAADSAGDEITGASDVRMAPAPPAYFCPDPVADAQTMGLLRPAEPARSIDGGSEWRPLRAVHVGD